MSETASLVLKVESEGVEKASQRLGSIAVTSGKVDAAAGGMRQSFRDFNKQMEATAQTSGELEGRLGGLAGSLQGLAAGAMAGMVSFASLRRVVAETTEYENLIARLEGVTGSAGSARVAFDALEEASDRTIFSENELAEAALRLKHTGLDPSIKSLTAFANTLKVESEGVEKASQRLGSIAVTSGKVDAAAGGMRQSFRDFNKQMEATAQTSGGLEGRLGGLEGRLGGLVGSLKGLAAGVIAGMVSFASLRRVVAETTEYENLIARLEGVTGSAGSARAAFDALEEASDRTIFTENEFAEAALRLKHTGLDPSVRSLTAFANISSATGKDLQSLTEMTLSASMGIYRSLKDLGIRAEASGNQIKMTYKGVTTEIGNSAQEIQGYLVRIGETDFAGAAERQLDTLGGAVKELGDAWGDLFREVGRSAVGDFIKTSIQLATGAVNELSAAMEGLLYTMSKKPAEMSATRAAALNQWIRQAATWDQGGGDEKMGALESLLADIQEKSTSPAQKNLEWYLAARKQLFDASVEYDFDFRAALNDLEAAYKQMSGGGGARAAGGGYTPAIARGRDTDFPAMFRAEAEDATRERDRIAEIAALEEKQRRMDEEYQREERMLEEAKAREREGLQSHYLTEQQQMDLAHQKRAEAIRAALEDEALTRAEYHQLMAKEDKKYSDERQAWVDAQTQVALKGGEDMFAGLAATAKNFGGEQSAAYRTLFALSKAFSVAQATMSIATGTAKALELGWPAGIAAGIQVAAQGAQLMAQITSANYSGAYDLGGRIPAGGIGLVGERGPELVRGPAEVTSRADTARMLQPNVRIVNAFDGATARNYQGSADEVVVMNIVRRNATTIRSLR